MQGDQKQRQRELILDPKRLQDMRIDAGLSQVKLAALARVSPQHMSALHRGYRGASEEVLARIARALGCEVRELRPASRTRVRS